MGSKTAKKRREKESGRLKNTEIPYEKGEKKLKP